ncbi:sodium:proton antiporter [Alicyclobacillus fastidiosus]|uniref:Sodium:proton antiporter n=1 Tax=Alicyclobacillus fastidiosus TaxID=392011 RepID=A0ABY6ZLA1_9BACL|nr:Na+/H+ antiporter NhaC family protein [Alicyclobacillus fastidiosus]WAH43237.1 sodium:proton antiporter [Alicyclobacillus fastidiosus]GMA65276.1 membrane protein [Alicyclobacillus fastidiosus]
MYGSIVSLVPFFVVIPIALWTKQVIPGLAIGLFIGAYLLHPSMLGGLQSAITYVVRETTTSGNLNLVLFLYGFGAFVGLIRVTGGVAGFAEWIGKRIKTERGAFVLTWASSIATFMAPDFRIITIAPVVRRIFTRLGVKPEKVAYVIDVTSTPLCAIVPLGTAFVGYMVGLMHTSLDHTRTTYTPYSLFIASVPFNFFAWVMLVVGFVLTFFTRNHARATAQTSQATEPDYLGSRNRRHIEQKMRQVAAMASMETGAIGAVPGVDVRRSDARQDTDKDIPDPVELVSERVHPSAANLIVPLVVLLVLTIGLTYVSGFANGGRGVFQALVQANASAAMLQALIATLVFMFVFYACRRQPIDRTMFGFMQGGNEMMSVIVLLVLIWAVSAVSSDLGFSQFCQREITRFVPHAFIVPALFVFGCVISYFIGSSFGTWGMLMPLGFSLAATGAGGLPLIAGAIFASGTFGGFASPLSDNTVAMATMMKLPVMRYANYKTKSAAIAAGICVLLYIVVEWVL